MLTVVEMMLFLLALLAMFLLSFSIPTFTGVFSFCTLERRENILVYSLGGIFLLILSLHTRSYLGRSLRKVQYFESKSLACISLCLRFSLRGYKSNHELSYSIYLHLL